ncbi:Peptide methionine sulfoxide reductase MsrB [Pontivivens insulae]|uniref:peptide-methionine (R)-S-oxide reductase n=1 Tax=Pontivivens insulae TaxID=1639689 RepID=A0A2R8AC04_9RHOB|nr:peptide-methionine (R)-S-oxide reductase MsrB [Pontivivens insulae]RED11247.1 peptide-methionine (R)-S-oxide reductase [Pontivivens insulae]SPF29580.1 Peptide methionine sulfoxide reductase MsrB [Pontivivens insulae]
MTLNRRSFLTGTVAMGGLAAVLGLPATADEGPFEITLSEETWRARLTPAQFAVLREEATERPFSSPLNEEYRSGTFHCAGCDNPLYESATKYDSGTGWPSFWEAIEGRVATKEDWSFFLGTRTEVHCARCGGHQGHIFADGPAPTGMRHCINGVALRFVAA